jgi:hypothetical protein
LFVLGLVFSVVSRACSSADTATVPNTSCMLFAAGIHPSHVLHLHPSLCVIHSLIHSFITTSSSSSLLQYSFVHFTYCIFIQLIAPVFNHSFITTSPSSSLLRYSFVHLTH